MELLIDKPIEKIEEDRLGRGEFAKTFAKMLLTSKNNDGLVLLLNGEWGCGKTSVVNLIKEQIKNDILNNKNLEYIPLLHDFSPWNVVSQDGIISQFFDTLSSGFARNKIKNILKTIRNSKVYETTFKTLNYIPFVNTNPAWGAVYNLKKKFDAYVDSLNDNKSLLERKNEIVNALRKSYTRHIVFIDDLDRLNDSEIKLVIQLIKSVCNFPNVIYVLSADAKIIQSALKNEQSFNAAGDKYLEKIIQSTFDIPNVRGDKIIELAYLDLDDLFKDKLSDDDVRRFQSYRYFGMLKSLNTIRDEKRFINCLRVTYDAYLDELDIPDFIAISYLKFVNHQIIQLLCDYSDHLFGKYYDRSGAPKNLEKKFKKELQQICNDESLFFIIKEMFPNMFTLYYDNPELYLSKRICTRNRFNLFLTLQMDTDDLSIERLNNALQNRKYDELVAFSRSISSAQGRKFLLHLANFVSISSDIFECEFVVEFLLKNLSKVGMEDKMFLVSKDYYVRDFIKKLCKKYSSSDAYKLIIMYIDEKSDIYALSELAIELNLKEQSDKHFYGFSDDEIKNITSTVCDLILERIKSNTLYLPRKARGIRLLFEQDKEELKEYFDALSDDIKIDLICDMVCIGSMTEKKQHLTFSYSLDLIECLIEQSMLFKLIDDKFENLENYQKQRLLVLKMQLSKFKSGDYHGEQFYLVDDINRYCKENNISFTASDSFENKSNE
jgi:hypothetical protein